MYEDTVYLDQMSVSSSQSSETQEKNDQNERNSAQASMYMNMSVNSSSFDDILPPPLPSNSSYNAVFKCLSSRMSIFAFSALSITYTFLLPLLVLILYLGFQRWRKRRSTSTATTSHSDVFTYHSIAMQLNEFLGVTFVFCGGYINLPEIMSLGLSVRSCTSFGLALFHLLTCVERYLAVVHPVTYLGLRQTGGVRIRNISIGCVWLLSFGWIAVNICLSDEFNLILYFCIMGLFVFVMSFCSISVLYALKRPGPGEVGGNRERVDQSKQRAFNTIMAILAVLLFGFVGNLLISVMNTSSVLTDMCVELLSPVWFNLPSRLVLPLLFLHRAGKLQCCKQN